MLSKDLNQPQLKTTMLDTVNRCPVYVEDEWLINLVSRYDVMLSESIIESMKNQLDTKWLVDFFKKLEIKVPLHVAAKMNPLDIEADVFMDLLTKNGYLKEDGSPEQLSIDNGLFKYRIRREFIKDKKSIDHLPELVVTLKGLFTFELIKLKLLIQLYDNAIKK